MGLFRILIEVWITQVYTFVKKISKYTHKVCVLHCKFVLQKGKETIQNTLNAGGRGRRAMVFPEWKWSRRGMGDYRGLAVQLCGAWTIWRHRSGEKARSHHPTLVDVVLGIQGQDFSELEILGSVWSPKGSNQGGSADLPRSPPGASCHQKGWVPVSTIRNLQVRKISGCQEDSRSGATSLPRQEPPGTISRPGKTQLGHPDISYLLT